MKRWCLLLALLGFASVASAQTPVNPRTVTFTPSTDHATVTSYEIAYFVTGATDPIQAAVDIGKPAPDATNICTAAINTQGIPFGSNYIAKMRAKAGTLYSDWSEASNLFSRLPGPPAKPVIK